MKKSTLIIVKVAEDQLKFDPGAIDTKVYCINNSDFALKIFFMNESFTIIDDETGDSVDHGTKNHSFTLKENGIKLIAQIAGWEWDGHVGMELSYKTNSDSGFITKSYDFKTSNGDFYIEKLKLKGVLIEPQ